jgi:Lipocalin-like domain
MEKFRERFFGAWRLNSFDQKLPGKTVYPYGPGATGVIFYSPSGVMCVHIARERERPLLAEAPSEDGYSEPPLTGEAVELSRSELEAAMESTLAYFGRYDVDPVARQVTHHVEGSSRPSFVGRDLIRLFEFAGDSLRLTPLPGAEPPIVLEWVRT